VRLAIRRQPFSQLTFFVTYGLVFSRGCCFVSFCFSRDVALCVFGCVGKCVVGAAVAARPAAAHVHM